MTKRKDRHWAAKIRKAKQSGRSELKLDEWSRFDFANHDFWLSPNNDNLDRIVYDQVGPVEFMTRFQGPGQPVVIQGATEGWLAHRHWNEATLVERYGNQRFKVGEDDDGKAVYLKLKHFIRYVHQGAERDDSPLYIFDSNFRGSGKKPVLPTRRWMKSLPVFPTSHRVLGKVSPSGSSTPVSTRYNSSSSEEEHGQCLPRKRRKPASSLTSQTTSPELSGSPVINAAERYCKGDLLADFRIPKYFAVDLFRLTGNRRPPHRWFVAGPARSGTGIHLDPLGTSAWNALVVGHKRWALFPPTTPRRLVDPPMKPFDHEAASWFYHVFPKFNQPPTSEFFRVYGLYYGYDCNNQREAWDLACRYKHLTLGEIVGMVQVLHRPGETIFVPGGWHHVVINLDFTLAFTQNYCAPASFDYVWLKTRFARPGLAAKLADQLAYRMCLTSYQQILDHIANQRHLSLDHPTSHRGFLTLLAQQPSDSPFVCRLLWDQIGSLRTVPPLFTSSSGSSSSTTSSNSSSSDSPVSEPVPPVTLSAKPGSVTHNNASMLQLWLEEVRHLKLDNALVQKLVQSCTCQPCQNWRETKLSSTV
ncbi:hypothetical protein IWQ62_002618 [Dispira parvispora]|uniref:JmjC domain-containing protein n=1 Tax=Dispira parvispora TaxID=1520584 RepID=A0A9W8AWC9_9FUNG|nr:hypothetical protein IWQ62_002618 [Dispira parvispora]